MSRSIGAFLLRRSSVYLVAGAVWSLVGMSYGLEAWKATSEQTWLQLDAMTGMVSALSQQHLNQYLRGFAFLDAHIAEHGIQRGENDVPRRLDNLLEEFLRAYPDSRACAVVSGAGSVLAAVGESGRHPVLGARMSALLRRLAATRPHANHPESIQVALHRGRMELGATLRTRGGPPLFVLLDVAMRGQANLWREQHLPNRAERHAVMGLLSGRGDLVAALPQNWPKTTGGQLLALGALRASMPYAARAPPANLNKVVDIGRNRNAMWVAMQNLHGLPLVAFVGIPRTAVELLWWRHARDALFGWLLLGAVLAAATGSYAYARNRELVQTRRTEEAERKARQSALFYAALVEALRVLRNPRRLGRGEVLQALAEVLAQLLGARAAFIAQSRQGAKWLDIVATAGPAADYGKGLRISASPDVREGGGPAGLALQSGEAQHCRVGDPRFAPWAARARTYGAEGVLAAAGRTRDGQSALLCILHGSSNPMLAHATGVVQQIANELAEFIDREADIARAMRCERYRGALRSIQHRLLSVGSEHAAVSAVAEAMVAETDVIEIQVFVASEDGSLHRQALVRGELAHCAQRDFGECPEDFAQLCALAWSARSPQFLFPPAEAGEADTCWSQPRFAGAGALVAWPLLSVAGEPDYGVMGLVLQDAAPIDEPMQELLQRIVHSTETSLAQIRKRAHIEWLAWRDSLTGLYNRRALLERLPDMLNAARRKGHLLAVCVLDLDDFKPVNDQWGHAAGDALLCSLGDRLRAGLREGDYVARLGGDEFVLVVAGLSCVAEAQAMLGRLESSLRLPYLLPGGQKAQVGLSMGLSVFPDDAQDAQELLQHADTALYWAKSDKSSTAPRCVPWVPGRESEPQREVSRPESINDTATCPGKEADGLG